MKLAAAHSTWRTGRGMLTLDRPCVMGILNVTPDSFWDGGSHVSVAAAVHHARAMVEAGADIIDVGGESTRPGAHSVPVQQEIDRVVPVIEALHLQLPDLPISIDTVKSETARAAAAAGAAIINDVSGLRLDATIADVAAGASLGLVLMHSRGSVTGMASYQLAQYGDDPVAEINDELTAAVSVAQARGVPRQAIVLDPGLGFAKRTEHSVAVLRSLDRIAGMGYPVLIGASRKRFLGEISGGLPPEERLAGGLAACVLALSKGARIFRVHDVAPTRRALDAAFAILGES
jgi:dihydropteroate synthase